MNTKKALKILKQKQEKEKENNSQLLNNRTMSQENVSRTDTLDHSSVYANSLEELEKLKRARELAFEEELLQRFKRRKIEFEIIDSQRTYEINRLTNENRQLKEKNIDYQRKIKKYGEISFGL